MERETGQRSRIHSVERVLWGVFVLNLAVAAAKFFYGLASGSASMQADGIHSVFDSVGNIIGLISITLAARPADAGHPYGHSKFETYGSVAIGVLLLFAAFEIGTGAVHKLSTGEYTAVVGPASFAVMVGTLAINCGVTLFERRRGRQLGSEILLADAAHTLSDALVSIGVIVGLGFVMAGYPAADPIMALVVTAAIVVSAVNVFRTALRTLSDKARIPPQDIVAAVADIPGILNVHHVRTRGTEGEIYCDIHILVDPAMTVAAAHQLGDEAERAIGEKYPAVVEVLVHVEPFGDPGEGESPIP